jgi:hypothetical protein
MLLCNFLGFSEFRHRDRHKIIFQQQKLKTPLLHISRTITHTAIRQPQHDNMMYYPFGFNEDSFLGSPHTSQRRRSTKDAARRHKQMAAAEEARRRSEQERYYRLQQKLEEERSAQDYMLHHQKKREEAKKERQRQARTRHLQQRQQEEDEQRQAYEAARLRRERAEAEEVDRQHQQQWSPYHYEEDSDQENNDAEFHFVRGPFGRLYRVRNPAFQQGIKHFSSKKVREPECKTVRATDGHCHRVKTEHKQETDSTTMDTSSEKENAQSKFRDIPITKNRTMDSDSDDDGAVVVTKLKHKDGKNSTRGKKKKTKITVVVEDASDSEYEDDFDSPWRNRRPSPGEWMEPVENFQ